METKEDKNKQEVKKAEDKVKFQWAEHEYETTQAGYDLILQILNPDDARLRMEHLEAYEEINKEKEQEIILRNIRPEDTLEFVYELSDKWKDIKEMREDLRTMIRYFKIEKFDQLKDCFSLD